MICIDPVFLASGLRDNAHGTTDIFRDPSPIESARRLKISWDQNSSNTPLQAPIYNSESYAGAATELWAMEFCKKDFIPPQTGF